MLAFLAMAAARIFLILALFVTWAHAQPGWKPTRPIALIVPNGPAGTSDRTARDLQRLLQKYRLVETPIVIINRPGGSGTLALNQLNAAPGDPHTLLLMNGAIIAAHILGLTPYRHSEFTPIASVAEEYFGMNVRAESPIRGANALLERLRKQPDALAFGTISVSGINYLSMVSALKQGGVDHKRLKTVTFASGSESTLALLGGHIDAVNTGLSNMAEHLKAGKMRTLAIGSPRRMPAPFTDVPTWRELNIDVVASGWRGVMGARGITPAQVAFWEGVLRKVMETPEWKQDLIDNYWVSNAMDAREARKRWDAEYFESKAMLTELGIARAR
jgi:putative tricarboxylic transport membrane protein